MSLGRYEVRDTAQPGKKLLGNDPNELFAMLSAQWISAIVVGPGSQGMRREPTRTIPRRGAFAGRGGD